MKIKFFNLIMAIGISSWVFCAQSSEGGYTGPSCDGTGTGAYFTGEYRNLFTEILKKNETEVNTKINNIWNHFFNPNGVNRVYYEVGNDMAYIYDTGNQDVRSEGMSYGMMICVQLNKKTEFDKLWKWVQAYMWRKSGNWDGYFAWQLKTNGSIKGETCAPDGEAYFITALFFAAHRWNDDSYAEAAREILRKSMSKTGAGSVYNMFNTTNNLITFVPYGDSRLHSDPSYNLPAFFELWARWSDTNQEFWKKTPGAARELLRKSSHPQTGLFPDYCKFDGTPYDGPYSGHDDSRYMYDAIRCAMNVGMDYNWFGVDNENQNSMMTKLLTFFKNNGYRNGQFDWNGNNPAGTYSEGIAGGNGVGCFALTDQNLAKENLEKLWNYNAPTGQWRYYNGMVYMLSMLHVSGNFKIYKPAPAQVDTTIIGVNEVLFDGERYTENTTFSTFYKCKIYNVTVKITGDPTGILTASADEFLVIPNPAKDHIVIYSEKDVFKIEIYNMKGMLVLTREKTKNIPISSLIQGTYILKIYTENEEIKATKLIVE